MMSGYRLKYFLAIFSQLFSTVFKSSVYILLSWFIDTWLISNERLIPAYGIGLGFVLLALCEGLFTFYSNSTANYIAEKMALRIRNNLYDQIQRLNFAYHATVDTGDLIQRATSDVDAVRRFFSEQAIGIGRICFLYAVNFIAIYRMDSSLALSTLMIVPLVFLMALFFFRKIGKRYEAYQNQDALLSTMLQENLTGVRVVKAFARQDYEIEKYRKENWKKFLLGKKLVFTEALFWPSTDLLCGFQMVISYMLGAYATISGRISVGDFVAFQALIVWIIWPIRNMGRLIVQMSRAFISFQRIMEIFANEQEPLDEGTVMPRKVPEGEINFDHVSFAYQPENETLHDLSFHVSPGQSVAIIGPTGSGKTSLINLLPRFYEYTSGRITLDGMELNRIPRNYLRKHIGIVEQEPFLFSRSIAENITYGAGREVSTDEIIQAAKAAAIHESILSFEKGYDTLVGERGVTLSGGQKQRIAIARTLLKNPKILLLDDATSSVDMDTEVEIRAALNELMKDRTTFIIAHRIQTIMQADLILVMDQGKIVQSGTHQELIQQEGFYRQIFNLQSQIEEALEKELSHGG
ncbi:MAG: ABC transporter ATP-binding protein [Flexilinea sp.]|nr:ABC transporter ATP-binding protein [Flexilinea sp.]